MCAIMTFCFESTAFPDIMPMGARGIANLRVLRRQVTNPKGKGNIFPFSLYSLRFISYLYARNEDIWYRNELRGTQ